MAFSWGHIEVDRASHLHRQLTLKGLVSSLAASFSTTTETSRLPLPVSRPQDVNQPGLRARRWPEPFPWIRKRVPLLAEAVSFHCGADTRGDGGRGCLRKGGKTQKVFLSSELERCLKSQARKEATAVSIENHPNQKKKPKTKEKKIFR